MKPSVQLALAIATSLSLGCGAGEETGGLGSLGGSAPVGGASGVGGAASSGAPATGGAVGQAGTSTSGGATAGGAATAGAATGGASGAATGGATTVGGAAGSGGTATVPTDGPGLYNAYCFSCHGAQGVGGPLAPETQHPVRDYSSWVVRHGRAQTTFPKPMEIVPPEKLSDAQLTLIWDYLDQPPQPTTGQALYHDYCANCHGADGKGGPTTRPIVNELAELKKQVRAGAHLGEFDMRREYMPVFKTDVITDAKLDLIYAYVDSL